MGALGADWARAWLVRCAQVVAAEREALNNLDRAIGDGDHGENLDRGFRALGGKLGDTATASPGEALRLAAATLMSTVGGAAGPLYGTALLRGAKAAGTEDLDAAALAQVLQAGAKGLTDRGRAEPGDKTMVDAWWPAARSAAEAAERGSSPEQVLEAAAQAAWQGARDTEPWVARKGRASYLGERSRGHRDPGAQSSALLLQAGLDAAREQAGSGTAGSGTTDSGTGHNATGSDG